MTRRPRTAKLSENLVVSSYLYAVQYIEFHDDKRRKDKGLLSYITVKVMQNMAVQTELLLDVRAREVYAWGSKHGGPLEEGQERS
jgi:hypothetical protein